MRLIYVPSLERPGARQLLEKLQIAFALKRESL